jgi:hypothetical protein
MLKSLLIIILTSITLYAETQTIDVEVNGRSFVELLKKWSDATLISYIDTDGNLYLLTKGSGLPTRAILLPGQVAEFKAAIDKAIEWKNTAKKNGLETTKEIKAIQNKSFQNDENGVKLYFFSANKSQQIDLIIKFFDYDNPFIQSELYFGQEQFENLLLIVQKYEETKVKLKEKVEKNNLLK